MAKGKPKSSRQLERYGKGIANHWRIEILLLLENHPGLTLDAIATMLKGHFKTISEHTRRLVASGLVTKQYRGRNVEHFLTPEGQTFVHFLKTFQHS